MQPFTSMPNQFVKPICGNILRMATHANLNAFYLGTLAEGIVSDACFYCVNQLILYLMFLYQKIPMPLARFVHRFKLMSCKMLSIFFQNILICTDISNKQTTMCIL